MINRLTSANWMLGGIILLCGLIQPVYHSMTISETQMEAKLAVDLLAKKQRHYYTAKEKYVFFPRDKYDNKYKKAMGDLNQQELSELVPGFQFQAYKGPKDALVIRALPAVNSLFNGAWALPFMIYEYKIKQAGGTGKGEWTYVLKESIGLF